MRVVPERADDQVRYFERQLVQWAAHADALLMPAEHLEALAQQTTEARAALEAQHAARRAAVSATKRLRDATAAMNQTGAKLIRFVRASAVSDGTDAYLKARIDPPKRPTTVGPPGQPTDFKTRVDAIGLVTLTWRCPNVPRHGGTKYIVDRSLDDGRSFANLDIVGKRRFADETLPAGTAVATYQVQAIRTTFRGPPARFTVRLGVDEATRALLAPDRMMRAA